MEEVIQETLLRRVHDIWSTACVPALGIPTRATLDLPFSMPFAVANLALLDVIAAPSGDRHYRYRLIGEEIAWIVGANPTGRGVDEVLTGRLRDRVLASLDRCCEDRRPDYLVFEFPSVTTARFARYCAPIADDGAGQVGQVLVAVKAAYDAAEPTAVHRDSYAGA